MPSLNEGQSTFTDIRSALDEEVKVSETKVPDETGADKIKVKPEPKEEVEEPEEEVDDEGNKVTKKAKKEEEDLKAKLGVDEDDADDKDEEDVVTDDTASLISPVRRKAILAKYPNLFKDFPYLNVAYSRDQQFTEVFPTVQEARQAQELLQEFDGFRNDLLQGKIDSVLKTVKEADPQAFARVVDNLLVGLGQVEPQAYYHILGNQTIATIQAMQHTARQTQNQDLLTAANILQQFIFGQANQQLQAQPFARPVQPNNEQNQLEQERAQFAQERFQSFSSDVDNKVSNKLKALIETNIDDSENPKMTPYIKQKAVNDCFNELAQAMKSDPAYMKQLGQAWERVVKSNFSQEALNTVQTMAINKGKLSLSKIILKVRSEALKGLGATPQRERTREPITPGRSTSSSNSGKKAPDVPKNMSTRDYFDLED